MNGNVLIITPIEVPILKSHIFPPPQGTASQMLVVGRFDPNPKRLRVRPRLFHSRRELCCHVPCTFYLCMIMRDTAGASARCVLPSMKASSDTRKKCRR